MLNEIFKLLMGIVLLAMIMLIALYYGGYYEL